MRINFPLVSRCWLLTKTSLLLIVAAISVSVVRADDRPPLVCMGSTITVSPARLRGGEHVVQDFLVKVDQPGRTQTFRFSAMNDFLAIRCEKDRNGGSLLLVNHYCGGSGCAESNFSVIDLETFKVLLNAKDRWKGNHEVAESVVGRKLKAFSCGHSKEEYCYNAKFE